MGLLNWLSSVGRKQWEGLKGAARGIYGFGSRIVHGIHNAGQWVDNALTSMKDIPVIGGLASLIQNNELYKDVQSGINTGSELWDQVGKAGSLIGGAIDQGFNRLPKGAVGSAPKGYKIMPSTSTGVATVKNPMVSAPMTNSPMTAAPAQRVVGIVNNMARGY